MRRMRMLGVVEGQRILMCRQPKLGVSPGLRSITSEMDAKPGLAGCDTLPIINALEGQGKETGCEEL